MSIREMIRRRKGSAGSHDSWTVTRLADRADEDGWKYYSLWHYNHAMAYWREGPGGHFGGYPVEILSLGVGRGTVSDQGGMRELFRELRAPYRFDRSGGYARIVNYETGEVVEDQARAVI